MARKRNKHTALDKSPAFNSTEASVKSKENRCSKIKASVLPLKADSEAVRTSDVDVRPAKRQKTNEVVDSDPSVSPIPEAGNLQNDHKNTEDVTSISTDNYRLPTELAHLQNKFNFTTMSILSSSKIEQKVRNLLLRTRIPGVMGDEIKAGVVVLNAKGLTISKMVSVIEIAKRAIKAEGANWFQYTSVSGELAKVKVKDQATVAKNPLAVADKDDEEAAFQKMGHRQTLVHDEDNNQNKKRVIPVLTTYFSRVPIPGLKALVSEQTNA